MDSWNIKLVGKFTIIGRITGKVEGIVFKYSTLIDKALTESDARELEKECIYTLKCHGVVVEEGTL